MKPYLIAAAILLVVVALAACVRRPAVKATAEDVTYDPAVQRQIADDSLAFLQEKIDDSMTFGQVADVFAALCAEPTADEEILFQAGTYEEILFEAGTYTFTGKPMFTVSLARQIPDGEDEYYQIRAEFLFRPDADNAGITETMWLDPKDGDAFSAARRSAAFVYADTHTAQSVDLRIDQS